MDNSETKYHENATLIERILWYVEHGYDHQAKLLANLGDHLEECFLWDVEFEG